MTTFYVDAQGAYFGGFDGAEPPEGAIQVPSAPASARDHWDGNSWVPVVEIPAKVTRRQGMLALLLRGHLSNVQPAIDGIADATQREMAQIEFDTAQDFERNWPTLLSIAAVIGLDANGLDELFVFAATL